MDQPPADLEEALLVLSLKNDEIQSLRSSLRMADKKNGIKVADLQFKLDQERGKCAESERKIAKVEESVGRLKELHEEQVRKHQGEVQRLMEAINELNAQERRKEREFKASLFEEKLKFERQRQHSHKLTTQLQQLHRHFDPKKILAVAEKQSIEEMPSYIELYQKYLEKEEEVKQLNLQTERLRAEVMLSMEESFKKLSSYEDVMESLSDKNIELEESIQKKEEELKKHTEEIHEKKKLLEIVKVEASEQFQHLNNEINELRTYVKEYQNDDEQVEGKGEQGDHRRVIEELEKIIEANQNQLITMQAQYDQKMLHLSEDNLRLKQELQELHNQSQSEKEYAETTFAHLQRAITEKDDLIVLLNASIRDQEDYFEQKKQEYERHILDMTELLKSLKGNEEEYRQNEALFKERIQSLSDEVSYLRMQVYSSDREQEVSEFHPADTQQQSTHNQLKRSKSGFASMLSKEQHRNLFADFKESSDLIQDDKFSPIDIGNYEQQPNWSEQYYSLLCRHNQFAKKVQSRLQRLKAKRHPNP